LKIAVVGSQGVGKSTLIKEFVRRRPEYVIIPEIAREMLERAGGTVPSWFDFQLELLWRKIEAETEARALTDQANDYCDRQLAQLEIELGQVAKQVKAGRTVIRARLMHGGEGGE